jgi:hypothetical protein
VRHTQSIHFIWFAFKQVSRWRIISQQHATIKQTLMQTRIRFIVLGECRRLTDGLINGCVHVLWEDCERWWRSTSNKQNKQQTVKPNHGNTFRQNKSLNHWPVPDFKCTTYWLIGIVVPGTTNDDLCDFSTRGGTGRPVQAKLWLLGLGAILMN